MIKTIKGFFHPQENKLGLKSYFTSTSVSSALLSVFLMLNPSIGQARDSTQPDYKGFNRIVSPGGEVRNSAKSLLDNLLVPFEQKGGTILSKVLEKGAITDINNLCTKSIINFLYGLGVDSSFKSRFQLYSQLGFEDKYEGTEKQNVSMIFKLRTSILKNQLAQKANSVDDIDAKQLFPIDGSKVLYMAKGNKKIFEGRIVHVEQNEKGGLTAVLQANTGLGKDVQFAVEYQDIKDLYSYILPLHIGKKILNGELAERNYGDFELDFNPEGINNIPDSQLNDSLSIEGVKTKSDFINWLVPIIEQVKDDLGAQEFPTSLVVAAGAYESYWGKHDRARETNNIFGIMTSKGKLRKFSDYKSAVEFFITLLSNGKHYRQFQNALAQKNVPLNKRLKLMTAALNNRYAQGEGAGEYSTKLLAIIKQNDLTSLDM